MRLPFLRNRERQLLRAGLLYRKGRGRVVWVNGVLFFGGTLFLLYNALDFLIEPNARATPIQLSWFCAALAGCVAAGYVYGFFLWRNLDRTFGEG